MSPLLLWVGLTGCSGEESEPTEPLPACTDGELLDGRECVPARCGLGPWGDLSVEGEAVYVLAAAAPGGDGSAEAPLAGLQAGLDLADDRHADAVIVGAGTYSEALDWSLSHAGVDVLGRCSDLVTIDAAGIERSGPLLASASRMEHRVLRGVSLTGGTYYGAVITGGTWTIEDLAVYGNQNVPMVVEPSDVVWIHELSFHDNLVFSEDEGFYGFAVSGGEARLTSCSVRDNPGMGLFVYNRGRLILEDCDVHGNTYNRTVGVAGGVLVADRAHLEVHDSRLTGNEGNVIEVAGTSTDEPATVLITGSELGAPTVAAGRGGSGLFGTFLDARLEDTVVVDTLGYGLRLGDGRVALEGVTIDRVWQDPEEDDALEVGIYTTRMQVSGSDLTVRGVGGMGIFNSGDHFEVAGLVVEDLTAGPLDEGFGTGALGVFSDAGTMVLRDPEIHGVPGPAVSVAYGELDLHGGLFSEVGASGDSRFGAVELALGASGTLDGTVIQDVEGVGLLVSLEGANVTATDLVVDGAPYGGAWIFDTGRAELIDPQISRTGGWGLTASQQGRLTLTGGTIREVDDGGLYPMGVALGAEESGVVEASGVLIEDIGGPGLAAATGILTCTDCTVRDTAFAGAYSALGATLTLVDTTIEGVSEDPNRGGGVGLLVEGTEQPTAAYVVGGQLSGAWLAGAWVNGEAELQLQDTALVGGPALELAPGAEVHGNALVATGGTPAWDGRKGLLLERVLVTGAGGPGLLLDGSSASLVDTDFEGNALDLQQQDCDSAPGLLSELELEGLSTSLCPEETALLLHFVLDYELSLPDLGSE